MADPTLSSLAALSATDLVDALADLPTREGGAAAFLAQADEATTAQLVPVLVKAIEGGFGEPAVRVILGDLLGRLGDPRLSAPADDAYWVDVELKSGDTVQIGRFPVTNQEFQAFVDAGGYDRADLWDEAGAAWLADCDNPWPVLAAREGFDQFMGPNQPVVGITFFEAAAFARYHGARLPQWYERVRAVRGAMKRPYPWGSPFGEGHTNSKEEVLGRPIAVGLYLGDRTPEGVCDLAGNVGEWVADESGNEQLYHPGAYDQPSMACWAKALTSQRRDARWGGLGFRLAKGDETEA